MAEHTKIEYADSTANPVMGCTGCELYDPDPAENHCYAATICRHYAGRKGWPANFAEPEHFPHRLPQALKWPDLTGTERPDKPWLDRYPRVVFVNDLSDGFCPDVDPEEWLTPHLQAMAESPHTWLLLTKWPQRMGAYFEDHELPRNVWPGTTIMRQGDDWRIQKLLGINGAAARFVSCEPLLGQINLREWLHPKFDSRTRATRFERINWVICGGESGPGARPMHPDWARSLVRQCRAASVPVFVKQMGTAWARETWSRYDGMTVYQAGDTKGAIKFPEDLRIREMPAGVSNVKAAVV